MLDHRFVIVFSNGFDDRFDKLKKYLNKSLIESIRFEISQLLFFEMGLMRDLMVGFTFSLSLVVWGRSGL